METTELLEALEVVFIGMGVLIVLILGVLVAGVMMIFGNWRQKADEGMADEGMAEAEIEEELLKCYSCAPQETEE